MQLLVAVVILLQEPTVGEVIGKMKERAARSGVARATIEPDVDPFFGRHEWPDSMVMQRRPHDTWILHTLDDGACFIVHERLDFDPGESWGGAAEPEKAYLTIGWTVVRPGEARALVRAGGRWCTHAFSPRGQLPDDPSDAARLVLYNMRPDLLAVLEQDLRIGRCTKDHVVLTAGSRTFVLDRQDWALTEVQERPIADRWFVAASEPTRTSVAKWSQHRGVRMPAVVPGASHVAYSENAGSAAKLEKFLPKDMVALEYPLASHEDYRARAAKNADDMTAAYGVVLTLEGAHRQKIKELALAGDAAGIGKLIKEQDAAFAALAMNSREVIGAILENKPADEARITRGSLALRAAHAWGAPFDSTVKAAELPEALQSLWPAASAPCDSARATYLHRLQLLARGHKAPKSPPEGALARLFFGEPPEQIRAATEVGSRDGEPFAVAVAWRALGELKDRAAFGVDARAAFERWCKGQPSSVSAAFRWRLAVLDGGDHVSGAREFIASLSERSKWPSYVQGLALEAADRILVRYDIGWGRAKADLDVAPLTDLVLETPHNSDGVREYVAGRLANALIGRPDERVFRLVTRLGVRGISGSEESFLTWSLDRLKASGTREELVSFARWLAGRDGRGDAAAKALPQILDILSSRFPDDMEVIEAEAVRAISGRPSTAFAAFERLLKSDEPARRATAMIGIAQCARRDTELAKRAVELLRKNTDGAEALGGSGWLCIAAALGEAREHEVALECARRGVATFLQLPVRDGELNDPTNHRSVFHVMLGRYLERAGRLEEAMREYKNAIALRPTEPKADMGSYGSRLSWLVDYQIMVIFPDDDDPSVVREQFYKTHGDDVFAKRVLAGQIPRLADESVARAAYARLASDDPAEREEASAALRKMGVAVLVVLKDGLAAADAELRGRVLAIAKDLAEPK